MDKIVQNRRNRRLMCQVQPIGIKDFHDDDDDNDDIIDSVTF